VDSPETSPKSLPTDGCSSEPSTHFTGIIMPWSTFQIYGVMLTSQCQGSRAVQLEDRCPVYSRCNEDTIPAAPILGKLICRGQAQGNVSGSSANCESGLMSGHLFGRYSSSLTMLSTSLSKSNSWSDLLYSSPRSYTRVKRQSPATSLPVVGLPGETGPLGR